MKAEKSNTVAVPEQPRQPTEKEAEAIAAASQSRAARPVRATMKFGTNEAGALDAAAPHDDPQGAFYMLAETFGTNSGEFVTAALLQLANGTRGRDGPTNGMAMNASLAMIGAIAPRDELEAALAVSMATTHDLSLEMLRRARHAETAEGMREFGNLATKLQRTFTGQMKQLSDWRRGGEQRVRHIHVYEGGQAVVAESVNVGGPNARMPIPPHALGAAMLSQDPFRDPVPGARDQGQEALPDARGPVAGGRRGIRIT